VFDQHVADVLELLTHDPARCGLPEARTGQPQRMCLRCQYRWAYHAGHDRSSGAEVKVATSGGSDGVLDVVTSKRGVRSACKKADVTLRAVLGAERLLVAALGSLSSSRPEREYADSTTLLHPGEFEASLAAQRRRAERGEGFGVG
jgi:hypothetical protein